MICALELLLLHNDRRETHIKSDASNLTRKQARDILEEAASGVFGLDIFS
jgi:hypothetical protein